MAWGFLPIKRWRSRIVESEFVWIFHGRCSISEAVNEYVNKTESLFYHAARDLGAAPQVVAFVWGLSLRRRLSQRRPRATAFKKSWHAEFRRFPSLSDCPMKLNMIPLRRSWSAYLICFFSFFFFFSCTQSHFSPHLSQGAIMWHLNLNIQKIPWPAQ